MRFEDAMANELRHGMTSLSSGDALAGAASFASGAGRHGKV